jgi:hypothetical protein
MQMAVGQLLLPSIIQRVTMYMKKMKFNKFAALSHRYRIPLIMGALVVIVYCVVFGKDKKLPVASTAPRLKSTNQR